MSKLLLRVPRRLGLTWILAVACLAGWSGFAYSLLSSRQQISTMSGHRDAALRDYERLKGAVGDLAQVEDKAASARAEYARAVQAWADARAKLGATQQELAALTQRVEQASDRVSRTGSLRTEPPKRPAPKPPN